MPAKDHHASDQSYREPVTKLSTFTTSRNTRPSTAEFRPTCTYCGVEHYLDPCAKFTKLDVRDRDELAKSVTICRLCLKPRHSAEQCCSRQICGLGGCQGKHHSLLHKPSDADQRSPKYTTTMNCSNVDTKVSAVSLAVITVEVTGPAGPCHLNALLDNGSDSTLITTETMVKLGLTGSETTLNLSTLSGDVVHHFERVKFRMSTNLADDTECEAWAVPKLPNLTKAFPTKVQLEKWKHLKVLSLCALEEPVSLLIGVDNPMAHWVLGRSYG